MQGIFKVVTNNGIQIHTADGIQLHIKKRKDNGYQYVYYKRKQIRLSHINEKSEHDSVFDYIFGGLSQKYPCHAVDYWIMRWRMKKKISYGDYKRSYLTSHSK